MVTRRSSAGQALTVRQNFQYNSRLFSFSCDIQLTLRLGHLRSRGHPPAAKLRDISCVQNIVDSSVCPTWGSR
ncbi:hypothetical protein DP20_3076 [Shigella flexneri]|nr:hypothetical protein DP20_3076 [Shigella flexneri]